MRTISLKAHFDGTAIQLDEPYNLPRDAQLLITILTPPSLTWWTELCAEGLLRAYGDWEPEYSIDDVLP
ncbi:MAG: hypothetical protein AB7G28_17260 [Pirellulales bacterium]